ncbi:MAG TPA: LysR family transcriptional regulator [Acetobacteraceae bacterium]|nr:LysR family transcriptional regulator [Acetobacteraceae bacterium]
MHDFRNLLVFREVVRAGGFSTAARALGVAPTSVSRAIARLEQELGARLFNRTTSEFHLTPEGAALAESVGGTLDALTRAMEEFAASRNKPTGRLRVSLPNSYGKFYVLPRLPQFRAEYPDIQLEIGFDDNRDNLVAAGFDVGVCYGVPNEAAYVSRVLCRPQLVLVASPDYLDLRGVPRTPADLAGHDAINVRLGTGELVSWAFHSVGAASEEPPVTYHPGGDMVFFDQIDGVVQAAAAGLGITAAHGYAALPYLLAGQLRSLLPAFELRARFGKGEVHVFFPHRAGMPPRVRAFVDFLVATGGDERIDVARFAA